MLQLDDPVVVVNGVGAVLRMSDVVLEIDDFDVFKLFGAIGSLHVEAEDSRAIDGVCTVGCREDDIGRYKGRAAATDGDEELQQNGAEHGAIRSERPRRLNSRGLMHLSSGYKHYSLCISCEGRLLPHSQYLARLRLDL